MMGEILGAVGKIIIGKGSMEERGGPLKIAQVSGDAARAGAAEFVWLMIVLSVNLGLINLFPIPMLDGGHLVMYGIEAARGRPIGERAQELAFRFGLALVLALMVFVTWNDIMSLMPGG
jgi:regulator of sigma E protease